MANKNFAYFVRIYFQDGCRLVTGLDGNNVSWSQSEKPLAMTESIARETMFQLQINGMSCEIIYDNINNICTRAITINARLDSVLEYYDKNRYTKVKE